MPTIIFDYSRILNAGCYEIVHHCVTSGLLNILEVAFNAEQDSSLNTKPLMPRSGRKSQDDQPNDSQTGTKRPWQEGVESNIITQDLGFKFLGFKRSAFRVLFWIFVGTGVFAKHDIKS